MEDRRSKDDKVSGRVWKAVETKVGKIRIAKAARRGVEGRDKKEVRRKEKEKGREKAKERKKVRSTKDSRGMGDLGERGGSGKEISTRKIS